MTFTCKYCGKSYQREQTLAVHMCEKKKRHQSKDETGIRLALQAYLKFYELTQGSAKLKTFDDFADSAYYRAFAKFGQYCVSIRAINPTQFTAWLLKKNKKLDYWCSDKLYTEYLVDYLKAEAVSDALARALEYSIDWSEKNNAPAHDCLRYGNTNLLVHAIMSGRISAWVLFNCESGQELLAKLDNSQVAAIWAYIDADFWNNKFKTYMADQEYAKEMLKQAGW